MATFPTGPKNLSTDAYSAGLTAPTSLASDWFNCTSGLVLTTAAVYTRTTAIGPDSSLTLPNTTPFRREQGRGTSIRVRMVYDSASTITTNFQYLIIGRRTTYANSGSNDASAWQFLPNRNGDVVVTLIPDTSNDIKFTVGSNTLRATQSDFAIHTHDNDGCDEFWLIPITAVAQSNGTASLFRVEVKMI